MAKYATTRLSSKGKSLSRGDSERPRPERGNQFVMIGEGDAVILKTITPPD